MMCPNWTHIKVHYYVCTYNIHPTYTYTTNVRTSYCNTWRTTGNKRFMQLATCKATCACLAWHKEYTYKKQRDKSRKRGNLKCYFTKPEGARVCFDDLLWRKYLQHVRKWYYGDLWPWIPPTKCKSKIPFLQKVL